MGEFVVETEVGQVVKNATTWVVARLVKVRGVECADLRLAVVGATRERTFTKSGVCVRRSQLPELRELVDKLCDAAGVGGQDADEGDEPEDEGD